MSASPSASPQLQRITVGDNADSWEAGGFALQRLADGATAVVIGQTAVVPVGGDDRGIQGLGIEGVACADLALFDSSGTPTGDSIEHPNGVGSIDHVVMMTGDCDATTNALTSAGFEARRVRRFVMGDVERRQTFFWMGDVILELVGPDEPEAEAEPPLLWGLAVTCPDLDASVAALGAERCSEARDAVQPGRRIATMRTRELGISVAIALMSPHVARPT